jgi:CRP-like cAMP-binding protein
MAIPPAVLQNFPLLRDIPAETLTRLGAGMMERSFARREVVIKKGEPGNVLGFLIEGRLQGVDFTVDGRSRVATLARDEARKLLVSTPAIAQRVTERLAQRLRLVAAQRTLLSVPNPAQRVCAQLLQLSVEVSDGKAVIAFAPTHQEIAIMINTSRETVTRVFQVLQARGILKRDGQQWHVADLAYLNDVAEGRTEPPKSA